MTSTQANERPTLQRGHPRLRGGQPLGPHPFTPQQMIGFSAICGTFVAALPLEAWGHSNGSLDNADEARAKSRLDDVDKFYRLSGSDSDFPSRMAAHISGILKPKILKAVGFLMGLLTTRAGSLLLFGRLCLSRSFPFVQSFVSLSPEMRGKALLSWAGSRFFILQRIFKLFRVYTLFCFYAKVDANGESSCWNAMGYSLPKLEEMSSDLSRKPLEGKVIDLLAATEDTLISDLDKVHFTILSDISHLRSKARQTQTSSTKEIGIQCDVVVVGSGSGGGVIAGVLAKAGLKVLVLEKGQYYARDDLTLLEGPSLKAMYEGAGTLSSDDGLVSILAGSTVGGGSAVNWSASFRTPKHVRDEWAQQHGLSLFATERYERAMDAVCAREGVQANCEQHNFQNGILAKGCSRLGYDIGEIPRNVGEAQHHCGWCNFGCRSGEKKSTSETWLVDAVKFGAVILSNCYVEEVLLQQNEGKKIKKAVGVLAGTLNLKLYIEASVTVVCGGSLNTPILLQKSGLTNENIGKHLRMHPVIFGWGYFPESPDNPAGNCYEGAIMTAVSKEAANWESSGYGALLETPITHPATFAALTPWLSASDHKARMRKYPRTSSIIVLARDRGSGIVKVDPSGVQLPYIKYSVDPQDELSMMDGLEIGLRALAAAGAEEVGTQHVDGETFTFTSSASSADFEEFLKRTRKKGIEGVKLPVCSAHQMGSCGMGRDEASSVVDETAETWEADSLFLGDASVFPTASGTNPMITVQSIAYCTAENILEKFQK